MTNARKLARVVSVWARPAISQIATGKIGTMTFARNLEQMLKGNGLVSQTYKIGDELQPFVCAAMDSIVEPILESYFGKLPDVSLPRLAHNIVDTAMLQTSYTIMEGLITFYQEDMRELKCLLEKNMPLVDDEESYELIK